MESTAKGYRLSSGREFHANGVDSAGLVSIGRRRDGRFVIGEGLDGTLYGATGDGEPGDPDPGDHPENWSADERRELAEFMIAQWTAFKASQSDALTIHSRKNPDGTITVWCTNVAGERVPWPAGLTVNDPNAVYE